MKSIDYRRLAAAALLASSAGVAVVATGCDEGPAEEAGEAIDDAADNTADAVDDAADNVEDAVDDTTR